MRVTVESDRPDVVFKDCYFEIDGSRQRRSKSNLNLKGPSPYGGNLFRLALDVSGHKERERRNIGREEPRMMLQALLSMFRRKEGQSLVEYALIIALVAVVLIAGLQALQGGITTAFNNVVAKL